MSSRWLMKAELGIGSFKLPPLFTHSSSLKPTLSLSFPTSSSSLSTPIFTTCAEARGSLLQVPLQDEDEDADADVDVVPLQDEDVDVVSDVDVDVEVAEGITMTQFCDKMIDFFLNQKPRPKEWREYLIFRHEWLKYRDSFYTRCQTRALSESVPLLKHKLSSLPPKLQKMDDEIEMHTQLLKEIQDNPTDINLIVANRRPHFNSAFFRHLTLLQRTYHTLEDRDVIARLAARCLSAISAYDNTLEIVDTLDVAQAKFDDILNSPSIDVACDKIKSLAKGKQLDSSLILLINSAWARAKESTTMKHEVKQIMYRIYKATKSSLRSIAPKEIKLLKYLLNIADPEERFSALATAFSPGGEHDAKDPEALYTTPKELHKWIKIMLDAYLLGQEEIEIREVKQINEPVVIQRLFILKETIEEEYLERGNKTDGDVNKSGVEEEEF